jgi:hypothetical protein
MSVALNGLSDFSSIESTHSRCLVLFIPAGQFVPHLFQCIHLFIYDAQMRIIRIYLIIKCLS